MPHLEPLVQTHHLEMALALVLVQELYLGHKLHHLRTHIQTVLQELYRYQLVRVQVPVLAQG